MKCDYVWKILIVGNSGVGKSSVILRFITDEYSTNVLATIGVDFKMKYLKIGDQVHKLALWDTAGQERFRGLTSSYYKGANGVILMYDVTNLESFEALSGWMKEVEEHCSSNPIFCIVANKTDLVSERIVTTKQGQDFAKKMSCMFLETSAKTSEGVELLFYELSSKLASLHKPHSQPVGIKLNQTPNNESSSICFC